MNMEETISIKNIQQNIIGYDKHVPLLNGETRQYINFDNAASTPVLKSVMDKVNEIAEWYSSIHRGTGFKSQLCSVAYDYAREVVADFVNVDISKHAIIFGKNATESINILANLYPTSKNDIILVSKMEHHSNDLPWRNQTKVIYINILPDGQLDEEHFLCLLKKYSGKIALVALTGASNVTGWVNNINYYATICHQHNTKIFIDAAQLAPHRVINMMEHNNPGHIDFLAFSAHKIYAPFGSGVLIGDKEFFNNGPPDYVGGGTVSIVSLDHTHWAETPQKDEAGSPNTIGAIALAASLQTIKKIGIENIIEHEKQLTSYILQKMQHIPNVDIYGSADPTIIENRLGVISFNIQNLPHALTAAILNYEGGIGVRNGCFCAHPYVKELLGIKENEAEELEKQIIDGDRSKLPGAVRASFGMYNTIKEIDRFIEILKEIANYNYNGEYILNRNKGDYRPKAFQLKFEDYFKFSV
jgi:cysteine desulfurase/selenocysteine lyase